MAFQRDRSIMILSAAYASLHRRSHSANPHQSRSGQSAPDLPCDGVCEWWREGVPNLFVCGGLSAAELPVVGETLQTCDHPNREPGRSVCREVRAGCFICDSDSVNPKCCPCSSCPCWTEIGTAMLVGTTNNGRSDLIRYLAPRLCTLPSICRHQIVESFADRHRFGF